MSQEQDPQEDSKPKPPRMGWGTCLFLLACAAGGTWYFYQSQDYIGIAAIVAVLLAALSGFKLGLTRMGASLAAIAAAIMFAPGLGIQYEQKISQLSGYTGLINRFLSIGAIGLGIFFVGTLLISLIAGRFFRNRPRLAKVNSWLGFGAGAVQGGVSLLLLLGGFLVLEPFELQRLNERNSRTELGSLVSNAVLNVSDQTHDSKLGPIVEEYNPFTRIPQLNKFKQIQDTVTTLSDPNKLQDLLGHPALQDLKNQAEIKATVAKLTEDPEIKEALLKGKMDRAAVHSLLSHPAIIELIDQPGFMEKAQSIIEASGTKPKFEI